MTFWRSASVSVVLLLALFAASTVAPPRFRRDTDTLAKKAWRTLYKDELNREAREQQTAGYYEGLLNEGSRVSAMNSLITGNRTFEWEDWNRPWRRQRGDFRYWDMHPNLATPNGNPQLELFTNGHGMADREYPLAKPGDAWRVALLGDSITRGQGAPAGRNYETLLEDHLNARHASKGGQRVEILNFAVGGYRITQIVDAALEWAPTFEPDVYVVPFSELTVFDRWGDHVTTLVQNGIDLKYDYLRQLVRESGLRPDDPSGTADAKLARFRLPTLRWALHEIRERARQDDARLVVVLLANGNDPEILEEEFAGVRELLTREGVPFIDLLDAFADLENPRAYRVGDNNLHPNEAGHRVLFERLYAELLEDAELLTLFTGSRATPGSLAAAR